MYAANTIADPWLPHKQQLIRLRRCPRCAEQVPASSLLKAEPCPRCANALRLDDADHVAQLVHTLRTDWREQRNVVFVAVAVAFFFAGMIPLLPGLVSAVALIAINVRLIRQPTRWLPSGVRTTVRLLIGLWMVALTTVSMLFSLVSSMLVFLLGIGAVLSSAAGVLVTMAYAEGALWLVERSIAWSAEMSPGATRASMYVPFALILLVALFVGASLGLVWGWLLPLVGGLG